MVLSYVHVCKTVMHTQLANPRLHDISDKSQAITLSSMVRQTNIYNHDVSVLQCPRTRRKALRMNSVKQPCPSVDGCQVILPHQELTLPNCFHQQRNHQGSNLACDRISSRCGFICNKPSLQCSLLLLDCVALSPWMGEPQSLSIWHSCVKQCYRQSCCSSSGPFSIHSAWKTAGDGRIFTCRPLEGRRE